MAIKRAVFMFIAFLRLAVAQAAPGGSRTKASKRVREPGTKQGWRNIVTPTAGTLTEPRQAHDDLPKRPISVIMLKAGPPDYPGGG